MRQVLCRDDDAKEPLALQMLLGLAVQHAAG